MFGYSLIEIVLAIFLLTGLFLAAFTVFDATAHDSVKLEHQLIAARLAEKISEELRSKNTASIAAASNVSFAYPESDYLYSIDLKPFPALANLQEISIHVTGPIDGSGQTSVHVTTLLGREPYP